MDKVSMIELHSYKGIDYEVCVYKLRYNLGFCGYVVFYVPIENGIMPKPRFVEGDKIFSTEDEAKDTLNNGAMCYIKNDLL